MKLDMGWRREEFALNVITSQYKNRIIGLGVQHFHLCMRSEMEGTDDVALPGCIYMLGYLLGKNGNVPQHSVGILKVILVGDGPPLNLFW